MSMSEAQVAAFCLGLPGAREDYKWGGVRVFSIAGNKMFALQNLRGESLAFKVDKALFLGHVDRPGIHPAPYLVRAQWIIMNTPYPLGSDELRGLLQRSHQLVVGKLPKRTQVGLWLEDRQ
ncbi:MmcQ/YjbR family DNA-binding protein [Pseudomonas fluorescens]|uniref:MmcQ/YjbR family DNA-binding protein n=1 Tax=Pseudomonas fluorescens TaxID=294 RepID=UPI00178535EE|nr:MmcQ/YjbR family DNA-binding protein [Pseudomonas fluorescens]MBD8099858.1 MmcQ/YjbR family DNA-binding protein [Pseudomonas fluorescens]MBD8774295.1 MmcQ/YjbR family DNA-binding protein [Pseudomonas fluorescens]MBD8781357.1 MmcQ/YjbR family DNA-binding protein [Pseudomonas fluorescens]MBD8796550.1 MmcQ/YjbR family DNA-binding protein [Pseudomonas fluorescens]